MNNGRYLQRSCVINIYPPETLTYLLTLILTRRYEKSRVIFILVNENVLLGDKLTNASHQSVTDLMKQYFLV